MPDICEELFAHEVTIITRRPNGATGVVYGEIQSDKADPQRVAEQILRETARALGPGRLRMVDADR
jgi:hypothetical protein